jgi:hypothetical protein
MSNLILLRECLTVRLPANIVTTGLFEAGVGAFAATVQTALKSSSQSDSALGGCVLPSPGLDDRPRVSGIECSNLPAGWIASVRRARQMLPLISKNLHEATLAGFALREGYSLSPRRVSEVTKSVLTGCRSGACLPTDSHHVEGQENASVYRDS